MQFRTRTTTLTIDEVLYLADTAEDPTDYYALTAERHWERLRTGPDSSTIAELADGAAPGFMVRYGTADMHVAAQVSYATNMSSLVSDVWGTHYLSDVAVFRGAKFVGMDSPMAHGEANRTEGARKAHSTRKANGKRTGRVPSCLCGTCSKCKARARKQASREAAALTGHALGLPSVHVE